jgi:hypothetical protein
MATSKNVVLDGAKRDEEIAAETYTFDGIDYHRVRITNAVEATLENLSAKLRGNARRLAAVNAKLARDVDKALDGDAPDDATEAAIAAAEAAELKLINQQGSLIAQQLAVLLVDADGNAVPLAVVESQDRDVRDEALRRMGHGSEDSDDPETDPTPPAA